MAGDVIERAAAGLRREQTVRGLLETACRELTAALEASACLISRVVGDLLVSLVEFSQQERLEVGHEYLISDYPLTKEVIVQGEARAVSLLDEDPEPNEAALLKRLGFESLLMVCLNAADSCWGLVEIYANGKRFEDGDAATAEAIAAHAGRELERLEQTD